MKGGGNKHTGSLSCVFAIWVGYSLCHLCWLWFNRNYLDYYVYSSEKLDLVHHLVCLSAGAILLLLQGSRGACRFDFSSGALVLLALASYLPAMSSWDAFRLSPLLMALALGRAQWQAVRHASGITEAGELHVRRRGACLLASVLPVLLNVDVLLYLGEHIFHYRSLVAGLIAVLLHYFALDVELIGHVFVFRGYGVDVNLECTGLSTLLLLLVLAYELWLLLGLSAGHLLRYFSLALVFSLLVTLVRNGVLLYFVGKPAFGLVHDSTGEPYVVAAFILFGLAVQGDMVRLFQRLGDNTSSRK